MALKPGYILDHLDSQRESILQFCADLVRRPSPNPPGDTRSVAEAVCALLESHGLPVEVVADQTHTPNLISSIEGISPGKHFVLIGHMDTYPAGDESQWSRPAFGGTLENGRLHGRGAGDMKSGLTALIFAYLTLATQRLFNGRLTLLAVSDEMNFSPHGARLLVAQRPDLLGDAVVDAEPTSPDFVLFGEKGMLWIEVTCKGASGAGAFAPGLPNAIEEMAVVLGEISGLREWQVTMPLEVTEALRVGGGATGVAAKAMTYVSDEVLPLVTVNFGLIAGGRKINLVADACRAEVDIRLPPGLALKQVTDFLDNVFARRENATYRIIQATEPNWSDPNDRLFKLMLAHGERVSGLKPRLEFGITASDTRLFRAHRIPAALIGPRIANQGAADESIDAEDTVRCAKVFALTANDYLTPMKADRRRASLSN